nr:putative ribonuclease H-like domain-containing protein [Tanacetum cinerariifolium]
MVFIKLLEPDDAQEIPNELYREANFLLSVVASTLMEPNKALIKDTKAEDVDLHLYRSMIGSLMYLIASRPGIMFVVCACARFQVTPKTSHLYALKRIFRYLKDQPKLGLWYPRDSPFDLKLFSIVIMLELALIGNQQQEFWTSAKVKTVNEDARLQALVDGKKVIVNVASIRRDLRLDDSEGTTYLPNAAIFEELARMSSTMASAIICLANNKKFNFSKYILDNMVKNLEAGVKFYMFLRFVQVFVNHQLDDMSQHKGIFVNSSLTKKDPLPSGEDRLQLNKLMEICKKLFDIVLSLEQTKINQAAKIKKLKKRVKKLEGKNKKRTHGLKRLYKVSLSARIVSSDEEGLGNQEDASKQERIAEIDVDEDLSLINKTTQDQRRMNEEDLFRVNDLDGDEVIMDVTAGENVEHDATVAEKEVSTAADEVITTAARTPQISKDDVTLAQTLIEIKAAKPRERGEERIAMEKDKANIDLIEEWDDVQATIDADRQLAEQL